MTIGVVIQARMGSTRLPGKVLRRIDDRPLLEHIVTRLGRLRCLTTTVIATSTEARDDVIEHWSTNLGVLCFRGSEADVLDRYWQCTQHFGFAHVVRLTADNPFTDVDELQHLLQLHVNGAYDYTHSFGQLPVGVGAVVFRREALGRSHAEGHAHHHREHVNEYIQERPDLFQIGQLTVPMAKRAPTLRLTVDVEEDLQRACRLARLASGRDLG
ncbi:MAG: hypothetical protein KIT73_04820, partial [Burkholderiales bacterium]|nr:hypothetical protein [Burkholderiales bacterium]